MSTRDTTARRMALALGGMAFLSPPALAHDSDFNVTLPVVSGNSTNSVELVLRVLHHGNGSRAVKTGTGRCGLSVTIEARDATGDNPTLVSKSASGSRLTLG